MSTSLLDLASLMEPLRGFVAVGRRMSITTAAAELCLSQSALSRQVQALEERLGVKLLLRGHRSIAFTPEGERLFRSANSSLQQLQDAIGIISTKGRHRPVTVSASIGVASLWLLPRLGHFMQLHSDIDVRVATSNRLLDTTTEDVDLVIRYTPAELLTQPATFLFRETVAPIAHPALGLTSINTQDDIARQVLLEFDDPGRPWLHWHDWLATAGWRNVKPKGMLRFNQYDQVVQSALAGQGIALGRLELVQPLLQGKRLMRVPTVLQCPVNEHAYWLIQANPEPRADVAAVVEWITAEAQANTRSTAG